MRGTVTSLAWMTLSIQKRLSSGINGLVFILKNVLKILKDSNYTKRL